MRLIHHRVWRRRHLPQMDNRLRLVFLEESFDKGVIRQIPNAKVERQVSRLSISLQAFLSAGDR